MYGILAYFGSEKAVMGWVDSYNATFFPLFDPTNMDHLVASIFRVNRWLINSMDRCKCVLWRVPRPYRVSLVGCGDILDAERSSLYQCRNTGRSILRERMSRRVCQKNAAFIKLASPMSQFRYKEYGYSMH